MAYIPGHDAVLELGSGTPDDVSAVGTALNIQERFTDLTRTTFGTAYAQRAGGVQELEFTFEGLVDSTTYGTIRGYFDGASQAFSLEVGDATGTSAGTYAGNGIITDMNASAAVDGDWTVSITMRSTGSYTFT